MNNLTRTISRIHSHCSFLQLFILLSLAILNFPSIGQAQSAPPMKKITKPEAEQLMNNFKEKNGESTILGQAFTKAQLEQMIQQYPDCNAFNVYFAVDKSGSYTGENQYMIMLAPAVFDAGKGTLKYVNDPGHDSSLFVPSILCPDQCGLMQNK